MKDKRLAAAETKVAELKAQLEEAHKSNHQLFNRNWNLTKELDQLHKLRDVLHLLMEVAREQDQKRK